MSDDWRDEAACLNSEVAPPEFFTIEADAPHRPKSMVREARMLAARLCDKKCPVKDECLADAERDRQRGVIVFGVRGGVFFNGSDQPPVPVRLARVTPVQVMVR